MNPEENSLLIEVIATLETAEEGLRSCYQVTDYPANGRSTQDYALNDVRCMLEKLRKIL